MIFERNEAPLTLDWKRIAFAHNRSDSWLENTKIENLYKFKAIKDTALADPIRFLIIKHAEDILEMPASVSKHHWWTGGWKDHVEQVIRLALMKVDELLIMGVKLGPNPEAEVLVGALLHDLEKFHRYRKVEPNYSKPKLFTRNGERVQVVNHWDYIKNSYSSGYGMLTPDLKSIQMAIELGFPNEEWLMNLICSAEGGYSEFARKMEPSHLGVALHTADFVSANILYKYGNGGV